MSEVSLEMGPIRVICDEAITGWLVRSLDNLDALVKNIKTKSLRLGGGLDEKETTLS
ncbi:hypothetical protein GCM10009069_21630 [Algimonas arctica]|uniref:Uncharacterized protein n=1 Tax=Algimonas arctica TaxID=1479486 RepID=A0A8J3CTG0_9PROT|nr:hypothetical protein GCM10009069_21630 [Algimonas arctica]